MLNNYLFIINTHIRHIFSVEGDFFLMSEAYEEIRRSGRFVYVYLIHLSR